MQRQDFVDRLDDELHRSFPDEQAGFQLSTDDVDAVQQALDKICADVSSEIGGSNPNEL